MARNPLNFSCFFALTTLCFLGGLQAQDIPSWSDWLAKSPAPPAESELTWRLRLKLLRQGSSIDRFRERRAWMTVDEALRQRPLWRREVESGSHFEAVQAALLLERMGGPEDHEVFASRLLRRQGQRSVVLALVPGRLQGLEAASDLAEALRDSRAVERRALLFALGRIGGADAARRLAAFIASDPKALELEAALLALGLAGDATQRQILAAFANADRESRSEVRRAAILALGLLGLPLDAEVDLLRERDARVREVYLAGLAHARQGLGGREREAAGPSGPLERRLMVLAAGSAPAPGLEEWLRARIREGRTAELPVVLAMLGHRSIGDALDLLSAALKSTDEEEALAGAIGLALWAVSNPRALRFEAFAAHPFTEVREIGLLALLAFAEEEVLRKALSQFRALEQPASLRSLAEDLCAIRAEDPRLATTIARAELQVRADRAGLSPSFAIRNLAGERMIQLLDLADALNPRPSGEGQGPSRPPRAPGADRRRALPTPTFEQEDLRRHLDAWPWFDRRESDAREFP